MQISVIVTTYNRPDALTRVLEGLSIQTQLPDEVIVADDGSTDETRQVAKAFSTGAVMPVVHLWQADYGFRVAAIRNKAIEKANGPYIVFLDGDCIPDPSFIQDHGRLAAAGFFFQGKRVLIDETLSPRFSAPTITTGRLKLLRSGHVANKHHLFHLPGLPASTSKRLSGIRSCNMGFFKSDLMAVNGFNADFEGWGREDSELVVRLYKYGLRRRQHNFAAICYHLWHPENPRNNLKHNDYLLEMAKVSDNYICRNGIFRR